MQDEPRIVDVEFVRQNEFIGALVFYENDMAGVGMARCHETDDFDEVRGKKLAVERAYPEIDSVFVETRVGEYL